MVALTPPDAPVPRPLTLLLLSGGLDSAALAAWQRPDRTLFVDYGQRPAATESAAAAAVAAELGLPHARVTVDASAVGAGVLAVGDAVLDSSPSPEWWPFRNQLLVTLAAAWALRAGGTAAGGWRVLLGTVAQDGRRHLDGTRDFFAAMDALLRAQEGAVGCDAPALDLETEELVTISGAADDVLAWTHSCHTSNRPCLDCPGCHKREQVLARLGRLS